MSIETPRWATRQSDKIQGRDPPLAALCEPRNNTAIIDRRYSKTCGRLLSLDLDIRRESGHVRACAI